jgi:C1A family cysteine protease
MTVHILNCMPSQSTSEDWGIVEAMQSGIAPAPLQLPSALDLRAIWWNIGDQRNTGSCTGWAVADSVIRWHMVQDQRIAPDQQLSVRYVWMASKETDKSISRPTTFIEQEGTSLKAALDIVRKYGIVPDEMLPFEKNVRYQESIKTFYATAARLRISAYFNLENNLETWRHWLATQGPILTRLNVDATWDQAALTGGVLADYQQPARGGHAVAIVGYTPDYFIVRNSWGTNFGDQGYAYASLAYTQAAFTEAYGVAL